MKASLKSVLLDMDGVVINSAAVSNDLLQVTAQSHGADLTLLEIESLAGASGVQFWSYVKEKHGLPEPAEVYRDSYDAAAEVAAYHSGLIPAGLVDLLHDLEACGIRTGLVTSASRWRTGHVLGLIDANFDVVVTGDDVASHKPAATPYLLAAKRLGVSPASCLAVEDSSPGMRSARNAGMVVLAYCGFRTDPASTNVAHQMLRSFEDESAQSFRGRYAAFC